MPRRSSRPARSYGLHAQVLLAFHFRFVRCGLALLAASVADTRFHQAALVADIISLTMLPLAAQRMATRAWLSLHLAGIRNLWRKLYRPAALREAAAARPAGAGGPEAYRVERLTIGTLLLTPLLLLAPTLAAFGLLVALLAAVPFTARLLLQHAPTALRRLPRGLAATFPRRLDRQQLATAAWFQPLPRNAGALVLRLHMT